MHYVAKAPDRIKLLFWDGTGAVLVSKRLEQGRFAWPAIADGAMRLERHIGLPD